MGVYIKGMEMPKDGAERCIVIRGDGKIRTFTGAPIDYATAVPVPPHGRLKDADCNTFPTIYRNPSNDYTRGWNACLKSVQQQPTIIEAEEGET